MKTWHNKRLVLKMLGGWFLLPVVKRLYFFVLSGSPKKQNFVFNNGFFFVLDENKLFFIWKNSYLMRFFDLVIGSGKYLIWVNIKILYIFKIFYQVSCITPFITTKEFYRKFVAGAKFGINNLFVYVAFVQIHIDVHDKPFKSW